MRAGYGRYFDFGYTNSNILFAAINATGIGAGTVFEVNDASGIRNPNGTLLRGRRSDSRTSSRRTRRAARCR